MLVPQSRILLISIGAFTLLFLYTAFNPGPRQALSGIASKYTKGNLEAQLKNGQETLKQALAKPAGPSDFQEMGRRTSNFSSLLEILSKDPSLDRNTFLQLLRFQFQWWDPSLSAYRPWEPPPPPPPKDQQVGQQPEQQHKPEVGIVMCVGSKNYVLAAHLIKNLRNAVHSNLPIQIAYAGDADLPVNLRLDIQSLDPDIELVDLIPLYKEDITGLKGGGFAMKPFAALASPFRKTILIDADIIFMQKPDKIFEEMAHNKTSLLYWHDRAYKKKNVGSRREWVKEQLGGKNPTHSLEKSLFWQEDLWDNMESGVVCIDKGVPSAFMSLLLTAWMNTKEVRDKVYKKVLGG